MNENEEGGNAFAIPDLWRPSSFAHFQHDTGAEEWDSLNYRIDRRQDSSFEGQDISSFSKIFFDLSLPGKASFEYGPFDPPETFESSSTKSTNDSVEGAPTNDAFEEAETLEEDPWSDLQLLIRNEKPLGFKSWETFLDKTFKEPRTTYLSEGGPSGLDAALTLPHRNAQLGKEHGPVLNSSSMLMGMALLVLGRESLLFQFGESEQSFRSCFEGGRISGYTVESFASLEAAFIGYGNKTRRIHQFVNEIYSSSKSCPTLISLANAFSTILSTLESQFGDISRSTRSVLQLQSLYHGPGLILSCLSEIISGISGAHCDEEFLSKLYSFVQDFEHTNTWLQPLIYEILARVSRPWLESVGGWMGFNKDVASGTLDKCINFVVERSETRKREDGKEFEEIQYAFLQNLIPKFIGYDDMEVIYETGRALRMLQAHSPEHPLVNPESLHSAEICQLEWHFSWQDVGSIQLKAKSYKSRLVASISRFHIPRPSREPSGVPVQTSEPSNCETFPSFEQVFPFQITDAIAEIETPILYDENLDALSQIVKKASSPSNEIEEMAHELFAPPLSLAAVLSFNPIIFTQALLVNQACLRLLFKEHNFRVHISLQHRYHLFGDGMFATRLSHALFDPELQSAERRRGYSRSGVSGLKLGSRDSWPPASSELRLSLMGILNDSYYNGQHSRAAESFRPELPGGLSFAIRDMSEDEFKRCMDPDSIEALDFLRLQYRPPSPIDAVISPSCLEKYDLIFKLLLRGTRMLFVVNQLSRDSTGRTPNRHRTNTVVRRFTWEAHNFISAICNYFSDGVRSNWSIFSQKLDDIENQLDDYDSGEYRGLHQLGSFHEKVLDRMMFSLLLRQRQTQVMKLLEEIFTSILIFARHMRSDAVDRMAIDAEIADSYEKFKKKLKVFMSVCRGLSEKKGPGASNNYELDHGWHEEFDKEDAREDRGNTLGQLILRLEMSGYYVKPGK